MKTVPGLVDLQVNGFVGVDFSDPTLTYADAVRAADALLDRGTTAFLATMITSRLETYRRNIPLLVKLMRSDAFAGRILGLHLEGPFISASPGAVGAHDPAYVQPPDLDTLDELIRLGQGHVRLLTVAAEVPNVDKVIRFARSRGIAVSIGHSLFTAEDLGRVNAAGATVLTHLGNGLPNSLPRHPNPIWSGLADDRFTAMIIADGHHLPDAVLKVMTRAKGAERLIVVSDAAPIAGLPPGDYDVLGNRAVLEPTGRLHNPEKQCLVGSSATMVVCMNRLASLGILGIDELITVGFHNPLRLIGVSPADVRTSVGRALAYREGRFHVLQEPT